MLSRKRLAMVAFIAFALLPPVSPMARTITVDGDGPADYSTIEAAVNAAGGGDTVFVKAGTYYECGIVLVQGFTSNKGGMILKGEGADVTRIIGRMDDFWSKDWSKEKAPGWPTLDPNRSPRWAAFIIHIGRQSEVEGFTLTWEENERGRGADLEGLFATIRRCKILGCYLGIYDSMGTEPLADWPVIEGNLIIDNRYGVVWYIGGCIPSGYCLADNNWWETTVESEIRAGFYAEEELFKDVYPWLKEPVDIENFKEKGEVGVHYNNIYGNEINLALFSPWYPPPWTAVEPCTWGKLKSKMR
ncbi:MAG: hypothetical protein DRQ02_09945 [Candidatus Latescibacterota bacterium]|nr:MAG: hypothetical protein DRQ02_09945 [Candidatus Latescibacterota bacterium]